MIGALCCIAIDAIPITVNADENFDHNAQPILDAPGKALKKIGRRGIQRTFDMPTNKAARS